jgi:aspartate racemase
MKTIGLIGGMSWESSAEYYRMINEEVRKKLGGLHSAKCILYSVDFAMIERLQVKGEWDEAGRILGDAAKSLEKAGADFIVLCTNTMHKVSHFIEESIDLPFIHIADATVKALNEAGFQKVGLLGTRYTMEEDYYKSRLQENRLEVLIPNEKDRRRVNQVIFEELCLGQIVLDSKNQYIQIINRLAEQGAEGIILGCTEIGLLIKAEDSSVPLFDTTRIHAAEIVKMAIGDIKS